jgi:branched-chain amino acid transport system permease protein
MKMSKIIKYFVTLGVILILPYLLEDQYSRHILNMVFINCILAISINLVFGYTGGLTFGHVAVYGIGAYTSALLSTKLGFSFLFSFCFAGVSGALVGIIIGYPTLKLAGPYFALATMGFHKVMEMIFLNWETVTGGPSGITGIPYPVIFGIQFKSEKSYYYLLVIVTLIIFMIYRNLIRSHQGKTITAMRDNAIAAAAMGINVPLVRISAFTMSTIFAALAGSLYAHMVKYVAPEAFPMGESITLLMMVVLGGPGFLMGPIYGSIVVVLANEYLQNLEQFNMLVFGIGIMVLLIFLPSGIAGLIERLKCYLWGKKEGIPYIREVGIEEMK